MPLVLFGLAVAFAAMLLFGGMELDASVMVLVQLGRADWAVTGSRWVTELGGWAVLVPATALGALLLLWRRDWAGAVLLVFATLSGRFAVDLVKDWTGRLRPEDQNHLVEVQSFAFPSAHAANATLVWLCLALLLPRSPRGRMWAVWAAVWTALAVGASRVVLGVHWPSDVIAGWAFGLFWTLILFRLAGRGTGEGTGGPLRHSLSRRNDTMDENSRTETARRTDDSELIEGMEDAPSQAGRSGHRIGQEVGTKDELNQAVGGAGVTRARDFDKGEEADLPRFNER